MTKQLNNNDINSRQGAFIGEKNRFNKSKSWRASRRRNLMKRFCMKEEVKMLYK